MSAFQLNLSTLTLGAKERLARLEAAGGIKSLLSPTSGLSPAAGSGTPVPAAPSGQRVSIERFVAGVGGSSGESSLSGGFSAGLPVFVTSSESLSVMCRGAVAGGVKFCTLDSQECSFSTHVKKVEVQVNAVYISTGRNSAFTHHHAPVDGLSDVQLADLLREVHPKDVWIRLLRGLSQVNEEASGFAPSPIKHVSILDALTPAKRRKTRYEEVAPGEGIFGTPGKRDANLRESFDDELVILPSVDSEDQSPEERINYMLGQWNQVITTINKLGSSLSTLRALTSEDVGDLDSKIMEVDSRVGTLPAAGGFEDCGTLSDALAWLRGLQVDLKAQVDRERADRVADASARDAALQQGLKGPLADLDRRFKQSLSEIQSAFEGVGDTLKMLSQEQERLTEFILRFNPTPTTQTSSTAVDSPQVLARLKAVEARLPSNQAGRLGGETFQTRVDVHSFVESNVPSNCFYLFHDVVTLLESLTTSHVERKDVLQEWYQSAKVGVNEASARHMASFRLVLPTVFGRTKEGAPVSAKHHLPSVKSFREWNTYDGVSGVKGYISSGMEDLKYQFRQDIDHALDLTRHSRARLLAMEMHEGSQNFVMELSSWVDSFYQELVTTSESTEEEAWEVVSACIKKMFEVLRVPRAQAANATMDPDPASQCSTYLWSLIQSHRIMREFLDARFRNHGAIAPVIVLHIFKTRVTRVAMTNTIKRLEGRIAALEKSKDKDHKAK